MTMTTIIIVGGEKEWEESKDKEEEEKEGPPAHIHSRLVWFRQIAELHHSLAVLYKEQAEDKE